LADSCEFREASEACSLVRSPFRARDQRGLIRRLLLRGGDLRLLGGDRGVQLLLLPVRVALDRGELRLECRELGPQRSGVGDGRRGGCGDLLLLRGDLAFLVAMSPCRPAISVCRRAACLDRADLLGQGGDALLGQPQVLLGLDHRSGRCGGVGVRSLGDTLKPHQLGAGVRHLLLGGVHNCLRGVTLATTAASSAVAVSIAFSWAFTAF
jgi:hypothetical protein